MLEQENGTMTDTEIAVKFNEHENQIKSLKHRMNDVEEENKKQFGILSSINELAANMKNMLEEQKRQGERLDDLEKRPLNEYDKFKWIVIGGLVSLFFAYVSEMI